LPVLVAMACDPDVPAVFEEDFEDCSGTCDFVPSGNGRAEIVETIHPGEHALRIEGDVTLTRVIDPAVDAVTLRWTVRGVISVSAVLDDSDGGTETVTVQGTKIAGTSSSEPYEEGPDGFRPFAGPLPSSQHVVSGIVLAHRATDAPATVDTLVLEQFGSPGCY
jgi:hypothetical protein